MERVASADASDLPSPAVVRAHAFRQLQEAAGMAEPLSLPPGDKPVDWAGLRIGTGPWGALPRAHASAGLGFAGRVSYSLVPSEPSRFVFGLALDQTYDPRGPASQGGPLWADRKSMAGRAVTSLDLRVGYVFTGRVMTYLTAGLATDTRRFDPLGGGSTIGVGLDYAIDERWSLSIEYRYVELKVDATWIGVGAVLQPVGGSIGSQSFDATLEYKIL